ncbi:nucleolar transcription factor 1-B-like isoform X3 [Rhinoderma darwinii]|uniref:nucleolar transcription factor 1-B-like isoform X3 n=1 Tax=Rhinoderma darwinii TaxID=43563 RepID=UPI003F678B9F
MNGAAGNEETNTMTAPSDQDIWSQEDTLILLKTMKTILPSSDSTKCKTTESRLDWNKLAFKTYTGDMCRQKWVEVTSETHPEFPKRPRSPYFRFLVEKKAIYVKLHPEMSNPDIKKTILQKYKELTDKKKEKYVQDFKNEREDFKKNLAKFREEHPELLQSTKKSDAPESPKTPPEQPRSKRKRKRSSKIAE